MSARPLGWIAPVDLGRVPHTGTRTAPPDVRLPPHVLLGHLPPIYDQGQVGSCTAETLAAGCELLAPRAGYAPERPDRVALYYRERARLGRTGDDSGAILADGVDALAQGWEPEQAHPTHWSSAWINPPAPLAADAPRLVSFEALDLDVDTLRWELASGHPVAVGLRITEGWWEVAGSVPSPEGAVVGGHAVLLVGYSVARRAWRVRNSWGAAWGEGGYAWLPFAWTSLPWCGEAHALRAIRRRAT